MRSYFYLSSHTVHIGTQKGLPLCKSPDKMSVREDINADSMGQTLDGSCATCRECYAIFLNKVLRQKGESHG